MNLSDFFIQSKFDELVKPLISQDLLTIKLERVKNLHNEILTEYQRIMNSRYHGSEEEMKNWSLEDQAYTKCLNFLRDIIRNVTDERIDKNGFFN